MLRGLRDCGMESPLLAVGDGALGLWAALDEVFSQTRHQRCWNHRVLNEVVPVAEHHLGRRILAVGLQPAHEVVPAQLALGPAGGAPHLTQPAADVGFVAGVRLRTDVAKRMRQRENALYLVFKNRPAPRAQLATTERRATIMTLLLGGARFVDGVYVPQLKEVPAA